ncbi:MAG: hypothetical protein V2A34_03115, partial [Lentisphaerota bacterium]
MFWTAAIVLPFSTTASLLPQARLLSMLVLSVFFLAALLDLLLGKSQLKGLMVRSPEVVRLACDQEGVIPLSCISEKRVVRRMRMALQWPDEIRPGMET